MGTDTGNDMGTIAGSITENIAGDITDTNLNDLFAQQQAAQRATPVVPLEVRLDRLTRLQEALITAEPAGRRHFRRFHLSPRVGKPPLRH